MISVAILLTPHNENDSLKIDGKLAKKSCKDESTKRKRIDEESDQAIKSIKQIKYTIDENTPGNEISEIPY